MPVYLKFCLPSLFFWTLILSCNDDKEDIPVLENKRRVECEKASAVCNGRDGLRFYQSTPLISQDANGNITIRDVWSSFVVCCDDFTGLMDSLTLYNQLLDSAIKNGLAFDRKDSIGNIKIEAGYSYYGDFPFKRWEWLRFGDSLFSWSMPTGEFFNEHKTELQGAYARCCL